MSVFIVVAAVAVLMLVYMISVLGVLPWFIYIPFVLLFALVFFWDKIRALFPVAKTSGRRMKSVTRNAKRTPAKRGGSRPSLGKRSGKRI